MIAYIGKREDRNAIAVTEIEAGLITPGLNGAVLLITEKEEIALDLSTVAFVMLADVGDWRQKDEERFDRYMDRAQAWAEEAAADETDKDPVS